MLVEGVGFLSSTFEEILDTLNRKYDFQMK